jgi:hypothetical protein
MDDVMARLAALEARQGSGPPDRGPGPPPPPNDDDGPPGPPGLGAGFDEKRVVDLIVRLVVDQVDHLLVRRLAEIRVDEEKLSKTISRVVDERLDHAVFRMSERLADAGVEPFVKLARDQKREKEKVTKQKMKKKKKQKKK